jgi:fructokinase
LHDRGRRRSALRRTSGWGRVPPVPGGGPFNTAVGLARLGVPVAYLGAVSRDRLGRRLLRTLVSASVDISLTADVDAPTPLAIVDPAEVEPSYSFHLTGTAHETLYEHLLDLPNEVATLHVGTLALATDPPGEAVAAFVERQAHDRVLMVDPNIRRSSAIAASTGGGSTGS